MKQNFLVRILFFMLVACPAQQSFSQCFQIESILVDACGGQEGLNEMVRFKTGSTTLNANTLDVNWPNNPWEGIVQNGITASKTAALNADIIAAGGCGQLVEPVNGIIPANATAILVTSYDIDTALNPFGAITGTIYIIYQDANTTAGHFANFGSGLRTLTMTSGSCVESVTYDRSLLEDETGVNTAANGATVLFDPAGNPDYVNYGCLAPVPPFTVNAGNAISACPGEIIVLNATAEGEQSVQWTAATGSFSNTAALTTNYTIPANATGTIVLTLTATNVCNATVSDTVTITVISSVTPNFPTALTICNGATAPTLNTSSPNGVVGIWNPAAISNTASGNYVFTPNAGQCASPVTLAVTVTNNIVPDFQTTLTICNGATAPTLNTSSPNGVTGIWNPATISNTASGSYTFTPNPGQCASPVTLLVTVTNNIVPDFQTTLTICSGATAPTLNTSSPNGVTGIWNPSTVSNTASGNYVFTPNPGQCASPVTLAVTVTNNIVPDFATALTVCNGATAPTLNTSSPNGVTGIWNPAAISNTASGNYVFTPNPGQCASPVTLVVTVTNNIVPDFQTTLTICNGATAPTLNTSSPNGVTGTWNPAAISNTASGNYVFTPNPGQCASPVTLVVTVTNNIVPDFATALTICNGATAPTLNTSSPNGVTGTWNPATVSNTESGSYVFTPNPGQCASSVTMEVTVSSFAGYTTTQYCSGTSYFVELIPTPSAADTPGIVWTDASGETVGNGNSFNVSAWVAAHPQTAFPIQFTVTVGNDSGCSASQTVTITGVFCSIPKGISPNNDGLNDAFDLSDLGVKNLTIYNRYGVKVYTAKNYTNQWRGQTDDGHELPDGTYYYLIETAASNQTGWVYISSNMN